MMKCAFAALCETPELSQNPTMEHHVCDGESTGIQVQIEPFSVCGWSVTFHNISAGLRTVPVPVQLKYYTEQQVFLAFPQM